MLHIIISGSGTQPKLQATAASVELPCILIPWLIVVLDTNAFACCSISVLLSDLLTTIHSARSSGTAGLSRRLVNRGSSFAISRSGKKALHRGISGHYPDLHFRGLHGIPYLLRCTSYTRLNPHILPQFNSHSLNNPQNPNIYAPAGSQ